jgi:hypothetical protein
MSWRKEQVDAFGEKVIFKQDAELIDYIQKNQITQAFGVGADVKYFSSHLTFVKSGPVNFCIYIVNEPFNFLELAKTLNYTLDKHVAPGGILYLAINKFLAEPVGVMLKLNDVYEVAIKEFIEQTVNAKIINFIYQPNDNGSYFNFAHPLTRFYLSNENNRKIQ